MNTIQENCPIIVGWLVYFASAILLGIKYPNGILSIYSSFPHESLLSIVFSFIVFILIDYLRFFISVQWIALPIFKSMKKFTQKSKIKFVLFQWLHYSFWVFLCTFPVSNYSYLIPASQGVQTAIVLIWTIGISFWAYNGVVADYVVSTIKTKEYLSEKTSA